MGKRYRYPGVLHFKSDDERIFRGRSTDTLKLYNKILLNQMTVLHAESGVGKSSLLQAGILPLIEKRKSKYIPITVRFGGDKRGLNEDKSTHDLQEDYLIKETIRQIKRKIPNINVDLPYIVPNDNDLWSLAKTIQKMDKSLLLMFDQFEELQVYSTIQIEHFKRKLSQIFLPELPSEIEEEVNENTIGNPNFTYYNLSQEEKKEYNLAISFLEEPMDNKAVFIVREDKLGTISLLTDYFPNILKNDYQLLPLDHESARMAIEDPAQNQGDFDTPVFSFSEGVVDRLLENLEDKNTNRIDPIQIQIICSNLERKKITKDSHVVLMDDVKSIGNIIQDFYNEKWKVVETQLEINPQDYIELKRKIIKTLVINGQRNLVHKDNIYKLPNGEDVISILEQEGLVLRITIGNGDYFRLSHDRLIEPFNRELQLFASNDRLHKKAEEARLNAEKQERIAIDVRQKALLDKQKAKATSFKKLSFFALISIGIIAIFATKLLSDRHANEVQKYLLLSESIKLNSPTLSYLIGKRGLDEVESSEALEHFLEVFDGEPHSYLLATIQVDSEIICANSQMGISEIAIHKTKSKSVWDYKDYYLKNDSIYEQGELIKKFTTNDRNLYAFDVDGILEIRNEENEPIAEFSDEYAVKFLRRPNVGNLAISKDEKYLLLDDILYNFETKEPIAEMPAYEGMRDQMVSTFFNDSRFIAVGYWSGYILVFSIDENRTDEIMQLTTLFKPPNGHLNSVITSLAIDDTDSYLMAGNRSNTIEVWEVDDLAMSRLEAENMEEGLKKDPIKVLDSHKGRITTLKISPNNKELLSGSGDGAAILWDFKTGKINSVLREGGDEIDFVDFFDNGSGFFTGNENSLSVWKRESPSKLYEENSLITFSPFEYYSRGMDEVNADVVYKNNKGINSQAGNVLRYLRNIPKINEYPENTNYAQSIQKSIGEVTVMYSELLDNPRFEDSVHTDFKDIIFRAYDNLTLTKINLLKQDVKLSEIEILTANSNVYSEGIQRFLKDTTRIATSVGYGERIIDLALEIYEIDPSSEQIEINLKSAQSVFNTFSQKEENALLGDNGLADLYEYFVLFYEETKKFDTAYNLAERYFDNYESPEFMTLMSRLGLYINKQQEVISLVENLDGDLDPNIKAYLSIAYIMDGQIDRGEGIYQELRIDLVGYNIPSFYLERIGEFETEGIKNQYLTNFKKKVEIDKSEEEDFVR